MRWPDAPAAEAGPDVLAQGPFAITVYRTSATGNETKDKGTLFQLTRDKLIYHSSRTDRPVVVTPRKNDFVRVESQSPPGSWVADPKNGAFTGKVIPPEPIDIRPAAFDKQAEGRYLFFALEHLQTQADGAISGGNAHALKACRQWAEKAAAYMGQKGFDPDLIRQYKALDLYCTDQEKLFRDARELFQKAYREANKLKREEAAAQARRDAAATLGFFQALVSAIPTTEFYSVDRYSGVIVEHQSIDAGGIAAGLGTMAQAQVNYAQEQSRLKVARESFAQRTAEQFQALQKQFDDRQKGRARAVRDLGVRRFGLPKTDLDEQREEVTQLLRATKDYTTLIDLLAQRAREARGSAPHDYPFLLVEIYGLKSSVPRTDVKKRADEMFAQAKQCTAAANLVPPGPLYDPHRKEILQTAAGLALQAAALEIGVHSWATAYNFKALYALRLIDLINTLGVADLGGDLRELRACALIQVGRKAEALQQAVEVEELRKQSPTFLYNLARFYCAADNSKEGFRCLEEAIKAGFREIRAARTSDDLAVLRRDKRFNGLVKVNAEVKVVFPQAGFGRPAAKGSNVEVTNRSSFALTNMKLRLVIVAAGVPRKTYNLVLDVPLQTNETYVWKDAFAVDLRQRPQGVLTIESDQGTAKELPTRR